MAETTTLTGPDLAVGISIADLPENAPVVGHARGEAVVLVRTGAEVRALGATCTHTLGISRGKLTSFPGKVDAYLEFQRENRER